MIIFGLIFGIIVILIINRYLIFLVVNIDVFDKKVSLFGIIFKKIGKFNIEVKYKKINYVNKLKLIVIVFVLFIFGVIIIFVIFGVINNDVWFVFNLIGLFVEVFRVNINIEFSKFGIILGLLVIVIIIYLLIRFKWIYLIVIVIILI